MRTRSQSRNSNRQQQQVNPTFVEPFNLVEPIENQAPPVVTMDDTRTMAQLLETPTVGYEDAIVVPEITADNFELKHGLLTLVQNKEFFGHDNEDPHAHIRYFNRINSTMKFPNDPSTSVKLMFFPFSLEGQPGFGLKKNRELQSKVEAEAPLGPLSLSGEKVTILSCLVSAFSPPLFSPRLGRFFRFFNESLHESCNRIKDILSSRSVCLMPSIESIGAISSLGGRAIDSSCPWLVKGMRQGSQSPQQRDRAILPNSGTIESLKLRNYRISQELNKLFYASGIGKHDKSVLHILASSLVFKERKLQRLTEEKGPISSASASSLLGRDTFIDFFSFFLGLQAKGRTACPTSRIEAYPPTSLPWEFRTSSKPFLALSNVLGEGSAVFASYAYEKLGDTPFLLRLSVSVVRGSRIEKGKTISKWKCLKLLLDRNERDSELADPYTQMADIEKMVLPTSQPKKIDPGILEEGRKYLPTNRVEWAGAGRVLSVLQGPKKNDSPIEKMCFSLYFAATKL
ncbi:hypothetical protein Tco_0620801 [Tanacetum coccineum]